MRENPWRTAFLTLRDEVETLTSPPRRTSAASASASSVYNLVQHLIFSQSNSLITAASVLPPLEVTSDATFLLELCVSSFIETKDLAPIFADTCNLIHDVFKRVPMEIINPSSLDPLLGSFGNLVEYFLGNVGATKLVSVNGAGTRAIKQFLDTLRILINAHHKKRSLPENVQSVKFLLRIVAFFSPELYTSPVSTGAQSCILITERIIPGCCSLWEIQATALTAIGEVISSVGSSFPAEIWKSTIEVLRKLMDVLVCRSQLMEDNVMDLFYTSLLHCLHLVLLNPQGSLTDHVPVFVAALRMFFAYGLDNRSQSDCVPAFNKEKKLGSKFSELSFEDSRKASGSLYRPPHLRRKDSLNPQHLKARDHISSVVDFVSSDSDYSDSEGSAKDIDLVRSSKARIAAINCIQDLCQADPKSFSAQWTMLLPTSNVLQPRKHEATLMSCLLFDPSLKARIASASTLVSMLDGPSSIFLQVAEYKESRKCGSFTALSTSLGQILMQLHTGILYLIKSEAHGGLLTSLFKILMLLIKYTPYSRMPRELLPTIIVSLEGMIEKGFQLKNDQTALKGLAFSCLTIALSTSPSSLDVKELLLKETSTGFVDAHGLSNVLSTIFRYSKQATNLTICFEALQALRAVSHNYPNITVTCWGQISIIVYRLLSLDNSGGSTRLLKGHIGNSFGPIYEKVITAAIKVLDESLRAISGFRGTEDASDDKSLETPFTYDCLRIKKISSAPVHELKEVEDAEAKACCLGWQQWCEAIEKHLPLTFSHNSAMGFRPNQHYKRLQCDYALNFNRDYLFEDPSANISLFSWLYPNEELKDQLRRVRAASITCLAGITSSVFFSLTKEEQAFIIGSLINAALNDEVPSVRSAACRAIGVITCFRQVSQSAELLNKLSHAAEFNAHDASISVRTTASWALANICDSLRHCTNDLLLEGAYSGLVALLTESALRLTKDGDKIKSNAVRALGNLSRFVPCRVVSSGYGEPVNSMGMSLKTNCPEMLPSSCEPNSSHRSLSGLYHLSFVGDSHFLDRMVQAFLSCVTTGNVKVQWNVCHALSYLFLNETIKLQNMDWAPSVFSVLLLLLRDSSNFKTRIQAAVALAVPVSINDYGGSYSDIVQSLQHILENITSENIAGPENFKYMVMLEKQLTSTMLHVLGLASCTENQLLKDFFIKKTSFFEEWFNALISRLPNKECNIEPEISSIENRKKEMVLQALKSLITVYEGRSPNATAQRFKNLFNSL